MAVWRSKRTANEGEARAKEGILTRMRRSFFFLAPLALAGLLSAVPGCRKAPPAPVPAAVPAPVDSAAAAQALLAKGRKALKTDLAAAIAAFTQARQLAAEDPDILSELGLAQFLAGDFDLALDTISAALRAAQSPAQTAGPAYNLGRIEEAAGHTDEAITAYELAFAARPRPELRQRLDALKAVREQGQPQPLAGPFASLSALCAALQNTQHVADEKDHSCGTEPCEFSCPLPDLGQLTSGLPAPMAEVRVFWSRVRSRPTAPDTGPAPEQWSGEPRCGFVNAAVRLGSQWYVAPSLGSFCGGTTQQGEVKLTRLAREPSGTGKLVALQLDATQNHGASGVKLASLTLLGVGPSRKPSRIGPILRSVLTTGETAPASADSLKTRDLTTYAWRFADGALLISGQTFETAVGDHRRSRETPRTLRYPLSLP